MKLERPVIGDYNSISAYIRAMLNWLAESDPNFSLRKATASLRRCSPALLCLIAQGKRNLSLDRVAELSRALRLSSSERAYLEKWVSWREQGRGPGKEPSGAPSRRFPRQRREGHNALLSDWLNVYLRDACRLREFRPDARILHRVLGGIASEKHIERSLRFLLREGFLRRTLDGRFVEHEPFITTTDEQVDADIQAFHRQALAIARKAVGLYPLERRRESALIIRLNRGSVRELRELLKEFYERLLLFADEHVDEEDALYQVIINLCPVGGKHCESQN